MLQLENSQRESKIPMRVDRIDGFTDLSVRPPSRILDNTEEETVDTNDYEEEFARDRVDYMEELRLAEPMVDLPLDCSPVINAGRLRTLLEEEKPEYFRKKFLYHFTKIDVLEKLFKDEGDLWCTRFNNLNDDSEWFIGLDYVSNYCKRHQMRDVADILLELPSETIRTPWICSFSQHSDKASMWGMYGGKEKGGYAVGFCRTQLEQFVARKNDPEDNSNSLYEEYYLLPCLYTSRDNHTIDRVLERIFRMYDSVDTRETLARWGCGDEIPIRLLSLVFALTLIIKHQSFDYENEWRLIIYTSEEKAVPTQRTDDIKEKTSQTQSEKLHILSQLFPTSIRNYFKHIVISPCGDINSNNQRLEAWEKEFNLGFRFSKSVSPYNGR